MAEDALGEVVAARGLALGARALDPELVALALVAGAGERGLADRRRMLEQGALALAERRRGARGRELGVQVGELAPSLVELTAQPVEPVPGLGSDARRESLGHEPVGLGAQALDLLPRAQGGRVAIVQVAAAVQLRLAAAGERELARARARARRR